MALSPGVQPNGPAKDSGTGLGNITISGAPSLREPLPDQRRGGQREPPRPGVRPVHRGRHPGDHHGHGRRLGRVRPLHRRRGQRPSPSRAATSFSGSFRTTLNNQSWEAKTPLTTEQTDKIVPTYEATLGGPILQDRLWFFLAGRDLKNQINTRREHQPHQHPLRHGRDAAALRGQAHRLAHARATRLIGSYIKIDDKRGRQLLRTILDRAACSTARPPRSCQAVNYTGVFTDNLLRRRPSTRSASSPSSARAPRSTDLIKGTLLLDRSRGNARYHSPTFCGVCGPRSATTRTTWSRLSYFLSTDRTGLPRPRRPATTPSTTSAWPTTTSRAATTGSSAPRAIIRGSDIFPVFASDGSTIIQFNPIPENSQGTNFKTNSVFVNDTWRFNDRLSFNLGVRYDKNDGKDAEGKKVAKDSNISPRLAADLRHQGRRQLVVQRQLRPVRGGDRQQHRRLARSSAGAAADVPVVLPRPGDQRRPERPPAHARTRRSAPALRLVPAPMAAPNDTSSLRIGIDIPGGSTVSAARSTRPYVTEYALGFDHAARRPAASSGPTSSTATGTTSTPPAPTVRPARCSRRQRPGRPDAGREQRQAVRAALRRPADPVPLPRLRPGCDFGGNWTLSHTQGNFDGENRGNGPITGQRRPLPGVQGPGVERPRGGPADRPAPPDHPLRPLQHLLDRPPGPQRQPARRATSPAIPTSARLGHADQPRHAGELRHQPRLPDARRRG